MNISGQGHSLILVQGHLDSIFSIFSNFFSLETTRPIEAKFHVEPPLDGGNEGLFKWSRSHDQDGRHAHIWIYGKKKKNKNLLSWNQKANDLETWYTASSITKFVQVMPLCWLWPIFTARSDLVPYAFVWEKIKTMGFSETIVVCDIKVGRCSQLGEYLKLYEYQRSRSFIDLRPNHSDSIFLNFFSSITAAFNISSALRWAIQDQWSSGFCLVWQAVVN